MNPGQSEIVPKWNSKSLLSFLLSLFLPLLMLFGINTLPATSLLTLILVLIFGVFPLILGILSLKEIRKTKGKGIIFAIIAVILGVVFVLFYGTGWLLWFFLRGSQL